MEKKKSGSLLQILIKKFPQYTGDKLYARILCADVYVNNECIRNPREKISEDAVVELRPRKYVSRGGYKLEKALEYWNIDCTGKTVVDAGSSTGGFTDCLLQNGAGLVHAVDVGYNQLAYSLRTNRQVNVLERCNIMEIHDLDPVPDFGVSDLSFRSLKGAASHICTLTSEKALIALVKPQFEYAGDPDFDGVLRNPEKIAGVLSFVGSYLEQEGCFVHGALESPITGSKGNREFLFLIRLNKPSGYSLKSLTDPLLAGS
ncbi:MAG: TlyA family RNA methyltransferase [Spirochaetales bacterium]|nr:TlyA family RNA methyltransferase [Spirochaetales bacterium]